jgi:phosphate transport system protein
MDDLHRTLFTVLRVADWEHGVATAVDVSLLSHFYERFADHALFVADQVVFAVTGELPVTDELAIRTFPDPATIGDAAR